MTTDPRPRRLRLREEYQASALLPEAAGARLHDLVPLFGLLAAVRDEEDRARLEKVCRQLLERLSEAHETSPPVLKLLGPRPHRTREGKLSYELFGDYNLEEARIRLWTRTAINKRWASSRTLLSTLCHEFMHHLDVTRLGFPNTFHTIGFFERTHRLYQAAIGQPHYPLAWHAPLRNGSHMIDWTETNRRKTRSGPSAGGTP
jgi:hypothetical protein